MPLSEDDIDRIGDKTKIGMGEVMKDHQKEHDNIHRRINAINIRIAYGSGLAFAAMAALDLWIKSVGK